MEQAAEGGRRRVNTTTKCAIGIKGKKERGREGEGRNKLQTGLQKKEETSDVSKEKRRADSIEQ